MILSGEKKEEYREVKEFWETRIGCTYQLGNGNYPKSDKFIGFNICHISSPNTITFTHGYAKNARKMIVECKCIDIGTARPEWSDNWQGDVFRIKLGEILKTENI